MNQANIDKEYLILSEIEENNTLTQRDLSYKLGVSVSTVNVLINKMSKEGLIKISQVSKRQVLYMLTPQGLIEKAKKTGEYLKVHYRAIYETKEKIKSVLGILLEKHDVIFILMPKNEMGEIVKIALEEYGLKYNMENIIILESIDELYNCEYEKPVFLYAEDNELSQSVQNIQLRTINLLAMI